MKKLFTLIKTYPSTTALLCMLAVAVPLMLSPIGALAINPIGGQRIMVMDGMLWYNAEYISEVFTQLGAHGRQVYLIFHVFDCLFAVTYAALLMTILKPLARAKWQWLLPIVPAVFDITENTLIQIMSAQHPAFWREFCSNTPLLASIAPVFTLLKWLGFLACLVMIVVLLVQKRKRPRKLLLFDLDGTLTDPQEGIVNAITHALHQLGWPAQPRELLATFIGPPLRDSFADTLGMPPELIEPAIAAYREYFAERGIFENKLYDGILELLQRLQAAGIPMALATSKPTVYAEKIAAHFGFAQYLDYIAGANLDGTRERKADVIAHALEVLAPPPGTQIVMIGDREFDVLGAAEHGIPCIGVLWGYGSREELASAGAQQIVRTMDELLEVLT
ncbi:MAG: HAD family hydrolase [Oscillospiraceae bacterium]|nr:HAD family hydrolase [Oscillospiraceae bacterium]